MKTSDKELPFLDIVMKKNDDKKLIVKKTNISFTKWPAFLLKFILAFELHSSLSRLFTTNVTL